MPVKTETFAMQDRGSVLTRFGKFSRVGGCVVRAKLVDEPQLPDQAKHVPFRILWCDQTRSQLINSGSNPGKLLFRRAHARETKSRSREKLDRTRPHNLDFVALHLEPVGGEQRNRRLNQISGSFSRKRKIVDPS